MYNFYKLNNLLVSCIQEKKHIFKFGTIVKTKLCKVELSQ